MNFVMGRVSRVDLWVKGSPRQKEQLSIQRISRVVADDCRVTGGLWQGKFQTDNEPEFILVGRNISSYDSYFRVLEDFIRMLS